MRIAPLRNGPSSDAMLLTQALMGERVTIYDRNGEGFAWGQLNGDGYVGWLPDRALAKPARQPTHKVTALADVCLSRSLDQTAAGRNAGDGDDAHGRRAKTAAFAVTRDGWYLPRRHVGGIVPLADDFVAVAERFVGTPYLWGGKSSLGIDCSGLVQVSLNAAGTGCPRDSDMQQDGLGRDIGAAETEDLQRGDLIFWKGHVAIVRDAGTIVHANAHHMATVIENTRDAIARIKAAGSEITGDQAAGLSISRSWRPRRRGFQPEGGGEQRAGVVGLRILEQLRGRALLHHLAVRASRSDGWRAKRPRADRAR